MSNLTEFQLRRAIESVAGRVEPITIGELVARTTAEQGFADPLGEVADQGQTLDEKLSRDTPGRWLFVACAAAAITLGLILVGSDRAPRIDATDPQPTTSTTTGPTTTTLPSSSPNIDVAVRFARAFENVDVVSAHNLIAPPPTEIRLSLWGATLEDQFEFWEIAGADARLQGCSQLPASESVECVFLIDDKVSRIQGLPALEVLAKFTIRDGLVQAATLDRRSVTEWTIDAWAPYAEWAEQNRPTDFARVYPAGFERSPAPAEPEIRELNRQLIDAYVRAMARQQLTDPLP